MTYPAANPPKQSGGALKWILLGCGGTVLLAVGFFAIAGYLVYRSVNTDPAKAEAAAQEIVTFQKPEGFRGMFSMSMMGMQMASLTRGTPNEQGSGMIMIASFPAGKDTQEQFRTQIDQSMKQQGQSREVSEQRPAETFKVRGQDVSAQVGVIGAKDSPARSLQYMLTIDGAPGKMLMITIQGPESTTDHAWVQKFLDTIK